MPYFTRPEPLDRLVEFYVMTRPVGWWKPVHDEAVRCGRIPDDRTPAAAAAPRPLIQRTWSPEDAQAWTREDWIAIVLSPVAYALVLFGLTHLLLARWSGLWMLLAASAVSLLIYWVIDPKLRAVSMEYETRQSRYIDDLERRLRWGEDG